MSPHDSSISAISPQREAQHAHADLWLFTHDHRRLALLHAAVVALALVIGTFLAIGLALQPLASRGLGVSEAIYRQLYSMHGLALVFLVALPAVPAILGNALLPELLGRERMAWPRLNLLGFHLVLAGCLLFLIAFVAAPVDTGWSFDVPFALSSEASLWWSQLAIAFVAAAGLCSSLNLLATFSESCRARRSLDGLPLFAWSLAIGALVVIVATIALGGSLVMLIAQRAGAADLLGSARPAADVRFDSWFWSWGHAAFGAMILAAIGAVSDVIESHTGGRGGASRAAVWSLLAIALFACTGHGVHVLGRESSQAAASSSSALALLSGVPFVVIVLGWAQALWRGPLRITAALGYALGFVVLLCLAGLAGVFLAMLPTGVYLQNTAFATAQFHFLVVGCGLFALLAGVHQQWPRWFGESARASRGLGACALLFAGVNLAFLPGFVRGYLGEPRRSVAWVDDSMHLGLVSAAGACLIVCALLLAGWNLLAAMPSAKVAVERERAP